jgi:ribonuclease HI
MGVSEPVVASFDGLCEPAFPGGRRNPGGLGCGGWFIPPYPAPGLENGLSGCRCYGSGLEMTNNVAEWRAALDVLHAISSTGWRGPVVLQGDSKLVVNQATGAWTCNAPHLVELRDQRRHALTHFAHVEVRWIPRDENWRADELSRQAYQEARASRREED